MNTGFAALGASHPSSPTRRGGAKQIGAQRLGGLWGFSRAKPYRSGTPDGLARKKPSAKALSFNLFAEREGFEPPDPLRSTVFKTAAFDHSAISPMSNFISPTPVFCEVERKGKDNF